MVILFQNGLEYGNRLIDATPDPVRRDLLGIVRAGLFLCSTKPLRPKGNFDFIFFFRSFNTALDRARFADAPPADVQPPSWLLFRDAALELLATVKYEDAERIMRSFDSVLLDSSEQPFDSFDMHFAFHCLKTSLDRQPALRTAMAGKSSEAPWTEGFFSE